MGRIVKILMRRDGLTEEEAKKEVKDFMESIEDSIQNGDLEEIEDALMSWFCLEPDYVFDVINAA